MIQQYAFLFPGQGSQYIGMGCDLDRDFPVAHAVFQEVDDTLQQNLSNLMFSGDIDELTQTQNAQPAIMAVSMAIWRILNKETNLTPHIFALAGHSLGEYTALCASGRINLSQCAQLLKIRGQAMADAAQQNSGGMLALLGATIEQAEQIAHQSGCFVANDNCAGQIVLSGKVADLTMAKMLSEHMEIKRAIPLRVAGAFHCPLMQSAQSALKKALEHISFAKSNIPIYCNVSAQVEYQNFDQLLLSQLVSPVRWRETILNMKYDNFIECGPKNILSGLVGRILPQATIYDTTDIPKIKDLIQKINEFDKDTEI